MTTQNSTEEYKEYVGRGINAVEDWLDLARRASTNLDAQQAFNGAANAALTAAVNLMREVAQ